jgi:hypothetical protein
MFVDIRSSREGMKKGAIGAFVSQVSARPT